MVAPLTTARQRVSIIAMRLLVALVLALITAAGVCHAQTWVIQGAEQFFRVEWASRTASGGSVIDGYIYNVSGTAAENVRLLIESLDPAGAVTAQTVRWVHGTVDNNGRSYFVVAVPAAGTYRVRVGAYDWVPSGPMN